MKRMLVVVVDNADKAYEGSKALERLNEESMIGLHDAVVVTKNSDGAITVVKTYETDPEATMGGTAVGTLIGVLGGPVGLAVGAASGFVIGAAADIARARVGRDFVKNRHALRSAVSETAVARRACCAAHVRRRRPIGGAGPSSQLSGRADDKNS